MIIEILQNGPRKPERKRSQKEPEKDGWNGTIQSLFRPCKNFFKATDNCFSALIERQEHHDWIRTATHKRGRGCENARKAKTRFVPLLHHCHHEALANVFVSLISRRAQGCWSEIRNSEYPTCVTSFRPGYLERADRIPACFVDCLCLFALYVPLIQ